MANKKPTRAERSKLAPGPALTELQLKKHLDDEKYKRADICWEQIQSLLDKYQCELNPVITIAPHGHKYLIQIHAK